MVKASSDQDKHFWSYKAHPKTNPFGHLRNAVPSGPSAVPSGPSAVPLVPRSATEYSDYVLEESPLLEFLP